MSTLLSISKLIQFHAVIRANAEMQVGRAARKKTSKQPPKIPYPYKKIEDIWQKNPQIIKRFLDIRWEYEQLCVEIEYICAKK